MFGLTNVIAAFKRLAASLNKSADLVDAANEKAERFLSFEDETPAIEGRIANGRAKARS
jgi:hypothetical protein